MWPLLFSLETRAAEYTHAAAADVHFSLDVACGTLTFRVGREPRVRVVGDLDVFRPTFEGSEKELRFLVPMDQITASRRSCDLVIDIEVPEGASLDAGSTNGTITVTKVRGLLVLETVNGDISVVDPGAEVRAAAVNGTLDVKGLKGEAELTTVNGDVVLEARELQDLRTQTVNGDTTVRSGAVRRVRSQTVNGDILFAGTLEAGARLDLESHGGHITVRVPSDPGFVLSLETFSGDIENRVNGATATRPQYGPGRHLDTTVGSGSARIEAQTFSGDIVIEPPVK